MSEWQPIETAPKDRAVLAWSIDFFASVIEIVWWEEDNSDGPGWALGDSGFRCTPTHWMPLPEPPDAPPQDH